MYGHTGARYTPCITENNLNYIAYTAANISIDTFYFGFMHTQALLPDRLL